MQQLNKKTEQPPVPQIINDVASVEFSRTLKRAGYPRTSSFYWYGNLPSLTMPQDIDAIAVEEKRKMRWLLVKEKPSEPNASAYTEKELLAFFKDKTRIPTITKEGDKFIGVINGKQLFFDKNKQNILVQGLIYG